MGGGVDRNDVATGADLNDLQEGGVHPLSANKAAGCERLLYYWLPPPTPSPCEGIESHGDQREVGGKGSWGHKKSASVAFR